MQWSYFEYQRQPEWFIVGLITEFREQDKNDENAFSKAIGGKN